MCGIVAFIGKAKNPNVAYQLTTSLMIKTESRGDDASGFWTTDAEENDKSLVYFSKEPTKSSQFVHSDMWKAIQGKPINCFVGHCRKSTCHGSENINRNNHPFVSADYRTALVHNGVVPEFDTLRSNYDVVSDCDSEILLRMIENGEQYPDDYVREELSSLRIKATGPQTIKDLKDEPIPYWSHRMIGLRDVFAQINYGAMAVAIGERWRDGTRALWLFRDKGRPLYVVDMRKSLGQIYAVSEKKILREAVESCPSAKTFVKGNMPIIEFPALYIWLLTVDLEGKFGIRKWSVNRQRKHDTTFAKERPNLVASTATHSPVRVLTNLNYESHEVNKSASLKKPSFPPIVKTEPKILIERDPEVLSEADDVKIQESIAALKVNQKKSLQKNADSPGPSSTTIPLLTHITASIKTPSHEVGAAGQCPFDDDKDDYEDINPTNTLIGPYPPPNLNLVPQRPLFEDGEEEETNDEPNEHDNLPLGTARPQKMVVKGFNTSRKIIDHAERDKLAFEIERIRKALSAIETHVEQLVQEDTMSAKEMQDLICCMELFADDISGQEYLTDKLQVMT